MTQRSLIQRCQWHHWSEYVASALNMSTKSKSYSIIRKYIWIRGPDGWDSCKTGIQISYYCLFKLIHSQALFRERILIEAKLYGSGGQKIILIRSTENHNNTTYWILINGFILSIFWANLQYSRIPWHTAENCFIKQIFKVRTWSESLFNGLLRSRIRFTFIFQCGSGSGIQAVKLIFPTKRVFNQNEIRDTPL